MFAYIKGVLTIVHSTYVVVEAQGIGYYLLVPCRLLGDLPSLGQTVQFYTTFVVRELSHTLYGFLNSQERDVFEVLMNVTGIGPKLALSLIGHLSFQELQSAVINQDIPTLCRVPGVGKKTAERLIVELKDKFHDLSPAGTNQFVASVSSPQSQYVQDAIQALLNLGYSQSIAQKAIKQSLKELPETSDLASLITAALRTCPKTSVG